MSILQKLATTTLIVGAMLGVPSAAFASTTGQAATRPATTQSAVTAVHRAPCTAVTFNAYHGTSKPACYAGAGTIRPDIKNVREVTTGEYRGCFLIRGGPTQALFHFTPHENILVRSGEMVYLQQARHPIVCRL
jgi:hypothetical protein